MILACSRYVATEYGERIRAIAPDVEFLTPDGEGTWDGDVDAAAIAYFSQDFWTATDRSALVRIFALPELRWFHSFAAGVDHPAFRLLLERGVLLTNSSGTSSVPIAQYVIGMMLRVVKRMDAWSESQRDRRWDNIESGELTGMTLGIIGVGHIGGEIARLAKAFGMRVAGCRRSPRKMRYVDELFPPERLHELLSQSDFVVLAVPLTSVTDRLIGEAELRAMRRDAWLINIARGRVVDEEALIVALKDGMIAGACLDVFEREPLPGESDLWSLPNVIVTPHNSGRSPLNLARQTEIFIDNLGRFMAGKPLRNRIRMEDL